MPYAKSMLIFTTLIWTTAALRMTGQQPVDLVKDALQTEEAFSHELGELELYENMQLKKAIEVLQLKLDESNEGKKWMYLQPPHTGTMTVQTALSKAIGKEVVHTHLVLTDRIKHELGSANWKAFDERISFTFLRNPWERVLSCAGWRGAIDSANVNRNLTKEVEIQEFRKFVKGLEHSNPYTKCGYLRNQKDWIYAQRPDETEARSQLTFIGHTSNMQNDFFKVCDLLGVPRIDVNAVAQHCASSCDVDKVVIQDGKMTQTHPEAGAKRRHRDYREYFDDETANIVATIMHKDIETFGFEFGQ